MRHQFKDFYTKIVVACKMLAAAPMQNFQQNLLRKVGLSALLLMSALLSVAPLASAKSNQTITGFAPATPVTYSTGRTFALSATGGGSGNPVTFASTTTTICTVSSSTVSVLKVGTCTLTANQAGNTTYNAAPQVNASVVINKGSQTITFGALAGKTLGAAPFTVSATASSALAVIFTSTTTSVCTVSSSTVTLVSAGNCTIAANQAGNTNFNAAPQVTQSFTVAKKSQTITFGALAGKTLGAAPFTVSATASSALTVAFTSTTTAVCTVSSSTVTLVSAGACTIAANQAGNATYSAALQVTQSFTVAKKSQTITFAALAGKTIGAAPFTVTATATSALAVAFTSTNTAVCTVSSATVTLVSAGTCTITANQAGNATYSAALQVTQSFAVAKISQAIMFAALPGKTLGAAPFTVSATASSGLAVAFTSTTPSVCTVSGSTVTLVSASTCTIAANQVGNATYSAASQVTQSFTVSGSQTITFGALAGKTLGAAPFTVSASASSGLPVTFTSTTTPVCTVSGSTVTLVSAGICTIAANQAGNGTYGPAPQVTQSFAIVVSTQSIAYTYDAIGRAVQVVASTGFSNQFNYDVVGNITAVSYDTASTLSIVEFAPAYGQAGTSVTINGSGFDSTAANNTVRFNGIAAAVSSATATSLNVVVPNAATTGTISIVNANGSVTSAASFVVESSSLPSGGDPIAINLAANQTTTFNFSGTAGQGFALSFTGISAAASGGSVNVTVTQPNGATLLTCSMTADAGCVLPYLPESGSYVVTITAGTSAVTLSVVLNADLTGVLTANVSTTFIANTVGQAGTYTFNWTAGQAAFLIISGDDIPGTTNIAVFSPNGTLLQSGTATTSPALFNTSPVVNGSAVLTFVNLPLTGNYSVRLSPPSGASDATGRMTIVATTAVSGLLTVDGAPIPVTLPGGQLRGYTFDGTAGQYVGLGLSNLTTPYTNQNFGVTVFNPDGSTLMNVVTTSTSVLGFALPPLPANGTYTVMLDPGQNSATLNLQLFSSVNGGVLTPNGSAFTFTPTSLGQGGISSFAGTAGQQNLSLVLTGNTFAGSSNFLVYQPDGTLLQTLTVPPATSLVVPLYLPVTGTYIVRLMPQQGPPGQIAITLTQAATGTLIADAAPVPVSLNVGQSGIFTFSGIAGQSLGLGVAGLVTTPSGGTLNYTINKPDGSQLNAVGGAFGSAIPVLPTTGTYTVLVNAGTSAATFNLVLSSDATGTLTSNGAALTFSPTRVGQAASYTFSATAGQNLNLSVSGDTFPGDNNSFVYKPDGTIMSFIDVNYVSGAPTAGALTLTNLPVTGNYTVRFAPRGDVGSVTIALQGDVVGTVTVDGSATQVNLTAAHNGRYTFNGTAGQALGLGVTGLGMTPSGGTLSVTINNPDGSMLGYLSGSAASTGYVMPLLPTTGTYTVVVSPGAYAATANLLLSSDASGVLTPNGAALTFNPTRVGQAASYTFSGTVGQNLSLSVSGDTFPGYVYYNVYNPWGAFLSGGYPYYTSGAGVSDSLTLANLPLTGTYTVRVAPQGGIVGSATVALRADIVGTLTLDGSATAGSLTTGQNGRYTFSGTAGEALGVGVSGLSTMPPGGTVSVTTIKPDGTTFYSSGYGNFTTTGPTSGVAIPLLPTTGTYTVLVNPGTNAATFNLLLSSDATGTLTPNGAALIFNPTRAGQQSASYTFAGTAAQNLSLSVSGDTFPGFINVYVYRPGGAQFAGGSVYYTGGAATAGTLLLNNLPVTGTYTVRIMLPNGAMGPVSVGLTSPSTLIVDAAATPVTLPAGIGGLFNFYGSVGQSLGVGVSGLNTTPSGGTVSVTIRKPDGSYFGNSVGYFTSTASAGGGALPPLPVAGTYTVSVDPGTNAATFNLAVSSDATGSLTANGAAAIFNPTKVGQNATYTFSGTAGQTMNLSMTNDTFVGYTYYYVYKPDGSGWTVGYLNYYGSGAGSSGTTALTNLPMTGTYTVRLVPPNGMLGTISTALNAPTPVTVDAAATPVSLTTGRIGLFSFTGSVGQTLGLGVSGLGTTPSGGTVNVTISRPDGSPLLSVNGVGTLTTTTTAGSVALPPLPVAGTYTVLVDPGTNAATFNLLLSSDATGTLTANGTATTFSPTRMGQNANYTFSGTAGQAVNLSLAGDTIVGTTFFYVYAPNGTLLSGFGGAYYLYSSGTATSASQTLANLPMAGTYTVRVMPPNGAQGSVLVGLNVPIALTADAAATPVSLTTGRPGLFSFTGSAGQNLGLGVSGLGTTPTGGTLNVTILNPDTSYLGTFVTTTTSGGFALPRLPMAGTYTVLVDPGTNAAAFNLLLSSDVTGTLTANGTALTFSPIRMGQNASYTFSGTAGQNMTLVITGDTIPGGYTYYYVYRPDGTQLTYGVVYYASGAGTAGSLALTNLPLTSTYTVRLEPAAGNASGSVTVAITSP